MLNSVKHNDDYVEFYIFALFKFNLIFIFMIQSVYYVIVYTTGGVQSSVYRRVFTSKVSAECFAKRSLYYSNKEVYNTTSFDGYQICSFSINLPF